MATSYMKFVKRIIVKNYVRRVEMRWKHLFSRDARLMTAYEMHINVNTVESYTCAKAQNMLNRGSYLLSNTM